MSAGPARNTTSFVSANVAQGMSSGLRGTMLVNGAT